MQRLKIKEKHTQAGQTENTWIIATSDHGDMNMEHQQYYKMVFWEGSSRVPLIISAGSNMNIPRGHTPLLSLSLSLSLLLSLTYLHEVYKRLLPFGERVRPPNWPERVKHTQKYTGVITDHITSSLDFFPTICEMANVSIPDDINSQLDGYSLFSFLQPENWEFEDDVEEEPEKKTRVYKGEEGDERPNYVMSQFHGDEIHLSWFMLRKVESLPFSAWLSFLIYLPFWAKLTIASYRYYHTVPVF